MRTVVKPVIAAMSAVAVAVPAGLVGAAPAQASAPAGTCTVAVHGSVNADGSVPMRVSYDEAVIHSSVSGSSGAPWSYTINFSGASGGPTSVTRDVPFGAGGFNFTVPAGYSSITGQMLVKPTSTVICDLAATGSVYLPLPTPVITVKAGGLTSSAAGLSREYTLTAGPRPFPSDATFNYSDGTTTIAGGTGGKVFTV